MSSRSKRTNISLVIGAVLLTTILGQTILTNNTNAAGDSASANASVVLNPTISLTLSSSDLTISSLNPSSYADSNSIDITVSTNALFGYYLSATAGDGDTTSTSHNNYLTNTANSDYKFTSLSTNKAALTNFDDGTWGYSYSRDNGSTWISGSQGTTSNGYNGLPVDNDDNGATGIALISTDSPTNNNSVKFKIGAKSSSTQAAGTYTNTISFYAVSKPLTTNFNDAFARAGKSTLNGYYQMQDMTASICSSVDANTSGQLIDSRDWQVYNVAKLDDGKCWMTESLNIAGGTALSPDNTDFSSSYSLPTTGGWNTSQAYSLVLPASATVDPSDSNILDSFDRFSVNNYAYVFNSGSKDCIGYKACYSYYSWDTATLGSGRTISEDNQNAPYSICPKNWHLPSTYHGNNSTADYRSLAIAYGGSNTISNYTSDTTPTGTTMYQNIVNDAQLLPNGYYKNGVFYSGTYFWASTSVPDINYAWLLSVLSNNFNTTYSNSRAFGLHVRCLAYN